MTTPLMWFLAYWLVMGVVVDLIVCRRPGYDGWSLLIAYTCGWAIVPLALAMQLLGVKPKRR